MIERHAANLTCKPCCPDSRWHQVNCHGILQVACRLAASTGVIMQPGPDNPISVPPRTDEIPPGGDDLEPIPPGIQRSSEAFRRDLPQLLQNQKLYGKWVAYHGGERIGISRDPADLYEECFRRDLHKDQFVVRCIV